MKAAIVTVSDSCFKGISEDRAGPSLARLLEEKGWTIAYRLTIPDEIDSIRKAVESVLVNQAVELLLTTGGTGIASRDVTPEAIRPLLHKEVPGFGELMRLRGTERTPMSALSRSLAGTIGRTLVLCLPGSVDGACQSLAAVMGLLPHATNLLAGNTEH